jgi:hypothetical protein
MSFHCPKCNRVVYSRRHKVCGFCGAEVSSDFSLTAAELAALGPGPGGLLTHLQRSAARPADCRAMFLAITPSGEQKANRIIGEELGRLGCKEADLAARSKNDLAKFANVGRDRRETTLPSKWIAARVQIGTSSAPNRCYIFGLRHSIKCRPSLNPMSNSNSDLRFDAFNGGIG